MTTWRRNVRKQKGRMPVDRLDLIDSYLRADKNERRRLLKRHGLAPQSIQGWAQAYFGQGLRALRRQLRLPAQ